MASAPALRSSLISSSTPIPSIGPRIEIVTPGPPTGSSPEYARTRWRSAWISSTETSPRDAVRGERGQLLLERRALAPELVVAGVEVRHEDGQVLGGQLGEAARTRLRPDLDDDQQPEDGRDGGDRELARQPVHVSRPVRSRGGRRRRARWRRERPRVAERDRPDERRHVHRLRRGQRDADAVALGPGAQEVDETGRRAQRVEEVGRAERRDLVRRCQVGRVDQERRPDIDDRGRRR